MSKGGGADPPLFYFLMKNPAARQMLFLSI